MSANRFFITLLFLCLFVPGQLFAGPFDSADTAVTTVINDRCTGCHTIERITAAINSGADMEQIEKRMIKLGANLSGRDRSVLGTFWGTPLKDTGKVEAEIDLTEYRSIINARCTGCHTIDRILQAMKEQKSFGAIADSMAKRGVVLTPNERQVMGTSWGNPLRD